MEKYPEADTALEIQSSQRNDIALSEAPDIKLSDDVLNHICSKITGDNLEDLKFLCKPYIKNKNWNDLNDVLQFWKTLEISVKQKNINWPFFLAELLFTIQRFDLMIQMGICKHKGQPLFTTRSVLDPLTKVLFMILDSLDEYDAKDVAEELSPLMSPHKSSMDLCTIFSELAFNEQLKPSFLQRLHSKLLNENVELANKLENVVNNDKWHSDYPVNTPSSNEEPSTNSDQRKSHLLRSVPSANSDDYYDMTSSPTGICVIINIENFNYERPNREGRIDEVTLKAIFESFDFEVEVKNNLSTTAIKTLLSELAEKDHTKYNCFVCCILSYGRERSVLGADNRYMDIYTDIIYKFSGINCRTLVNKPKIFIMDLIRPAFLDVEEDGPADIGTAIQYPPSMSDFLLVQATTPEIKHKSTFISCLNKELTENGHKMDILVILRRVKNKMLEKNKSKKTGKIKKPIPFTSFTLTKDLILRKKGEKFLIEN